MIDLTIKVSASEHRALLRMDAILTRARAGRATDEDVNEHAELRQKLCAGLLTSALIAIADQQPKSPTLLEVANG